MNYKYTETEKKQRAERGFADIDAKNIDSWFIRIMPEMLKALRDDLHGYPSSFVAFPKNSKSISSSEDENSVGMVKWKDTIDRMIFLLREMNEETCSVKNPYEDKYAIINEDYIQKYGLFGEGLKTEAEKAEERDKEYKRMYSAEDFPDIYPSTNEILNEYFKYDDFICEYRDKCRKEFFDLFSQNFWNLWD